MKENVESLLQRCIDKRASDIHFITTNSEVKIRCRVDGEMEDDSSISVDKYHKMIAYLKFISRLDISDKKKAQSGIMEYNHNDVLYNIRISTLPQSIGHEACVMRLLPAEFQRVVHPAPALQQLMKLNAGLILITGPTGSGKSTLMYQLLTYAKDQLNRHIITIEDPVEQRLDGTVQVNVNMKADITYQTSIKAILRCDPDIMMIGEIRDAETARHVINASLSGHLVLTTMHAGDAAGAVARLIEMGVSRTELQQSIAAVTNQRLIRTTEGRQLVLELLTTEQLAELVSGRVPADFLSLTDQIRQMYEQHRISLSELEKFYVVEQ